MADFYVKYMTQDAVGTIANAFLTAADQYGINHKVRISLIIAKQLPVSFRFVFNQQKRTTKPSILRSQANLLSLLRKIGRQVNSSFLYYIFSSDEETKEDIPPEKSERAPDFQNENEMKPMYQSARLLGKLYREIKGIEDVMSLAADKDEQSEIRVLLLLLIPMKITFFT